MAAALATREATQTLYMDRDALDSTPFTKETERTGMFYTPGSPMNEDESHNNANEDDMDENMTSSASGRDSES